MVAGLEAAGHLRAGPVRDAFLAVRREVLMPQAYVRRSGPDETPPRWDLLDWAVPADREELLGLLYGGESVLIQHDGEPILGRVPSPRSGGSMTAMSSTAAMTVALLQRLDLRPGQRVLDVGTGAGVTAAVACLIAGDAGVVTVDRDEHVTAAARERLALLGHRPTAVTGDGQNGWPAGAYYDRIFVSYAVTRVPEAWPQQLAAGGLALATLSTSSPSWPGLAVLTRTGSGRVRARLEAVRLGHRAGHGWSQLYLKPGLRGRIEAADGGSTRTTHTGPPPDDARGLWLALDHLHPGLVRNWAADHLVIGAPDCGSWVTARPDDSGTWTVTVCGPRDIWAEIRTPPPDGRRPEHRPPTDCTSNRTEPSGSAPAAGRTSCCPGHCPPPSSRQRTSRRKPPNPPWCRRSSPHDLTRPHFHRCPVRRLPVQEGPVHGHRRARLPPRVLP
ncbi:protein-L-isoaspartate O-methyltransferase [Streptomyces sp. 3211.6]|uniref:protein-L-isoaspartate O-methyltransferase family protein n=1 Tax=Streptomyces sp. 3211.6 TaxID=1938845 RepID=UPI0021C7AA44|nr:methyltransferase domain-containing protein [Streptomyces sp. 3211.6]